MPDGPGRPRPDPARLQRPPARRGLGPLRGDHRELQAPGAGDGRDHRDQTDQRPRGVHPRQRVLPRRDRGRRLLRLRRLLRPRPRRRRRDREGDGRVDRRGRAEPRPLGHGHPPLRRPVPLALLHPRADQGELRDLLRHPLPQPRAPGRAAAAGLPGQRLAPRARRRLRREIRLGAGQLVRVERGRGRRGAAARAAGPASTGRRRSAPSTAPPARRSRSSTSPRSPSSRSRAPAPPSSSKASATTGSPATPGKITYTQMLNHRGGIECDFTVARLAEDRFSIVTGTAFGNHDREWMRRHLPGRRQRPDQRRHLAAGLLRDLGAAGARRAGAADPRRPRQRGLPLHVGARDHGRRRPGAGAARHLRRRARLGALLPDRVRARPLAGDLGGGGAARHRRRRLPGDRLDAAREGLPGLGRRHHPRRDPLRGRRRLLRQARQGGRLHRPRRPARGEGARPALAALAA